MVEARVLVLETKVEGLDHKLDNVTNLVTQMSLDLAKYRGAWGMFLMIGSAISAALTLWFKFGGNK